MKEILEVRDFAIKCHGDQMYGEHPYVYHLDQVNQILIKFEYDTNFWRCCAYLHDTMEDTNVSISDIGLYYGFTIYMVTWACTGVGANRKARQQCIRDRLVAYPLACPVKCSDRIANIAMSIQEKNKDKFLMYLKEKNTFESVVKSHVSEEMWNYLEEITSSGIEIFELMGSGQDF